MSVDALMQMVVQVPPLVKSFCLVSYGAWFVWYHYKWLSRSVENIYLHGKITYPFVAVYGVCMTSYVLVYYFLDAGMIVRSFVLAMLTTITQVSVPLSEGKRFGDFCAFFPMMFYIFVVMIKP